VADVVLDENVYIRALQAECSGEETDERSARIVGFVQANHRWIFTNDVVTAYLRQYSRNTCRGVTSSRLITSLTSILADQGRCYFVENPPIVEGSYHRKDRHVVAAAAAVRDSYLVTMDRRLVQALEAAEIPAEHGFRVISVDIAEAILSA
jgi:predicted nucleic acid-binding protein